MDPEWNRKMKGSRSGGGGGGWCLGFGGHHENVFGKIRKPEYIMKE